MLSLGKRYSNDITQLIQDEISESNQKKLQIELDLKIKALKTQTHV